MKYIGGDGHFSCNRVKRLGKLKYIKGNAYFDESWVSDLGMLNFIGGDIEIYDAPLTEKAFESVKVGGEIRKGQWKRK